MGKCRCRWSGQSGVEWSGVEWSVPYMRCAQACSGKQPSVHTRHQAQRERRGRGRGRGATRLTASKLTWPPMDSRRAAGAYSSLAFRPRSRSGGWQAGRLAGWPASRRLPPQTPHSRVDCAQAWRWDVRPGLERKVRVLAAGQLRNGGRSGPSGAASAAAWGSGSRPGACRAWQRVWERAWAAQVGTCAMVKAAQPHRTALD